MRYWAYLAGKLVVAAPPLYGLMRFIVSQFPASKSAQAPLIYGPQYLACDFWLLAWFLFSAGVLWIIVWDQRRRCRVCLRRLRMPIETGSRGFTLLLGIPRIETICPYGHGTLREDESQLAGLTNAEWTPHSDDIWDELCTPNKDAGQDT
jgi:hypothetical protein